MSERIPESEYSVRQQIPEFQSYFSRWKLQGENTRREIDYAPDLRYGPAEIESLDYFGSSAPNPPLLIFIHGGYWRAFDKSDFSWIAPPFLAEGASVAIVNYGLAPATPLEEIVAQTRRACAWLGQQSGRLGFDRQRMVCSGHSAGGHLTAMIVSEGAPSLDPHLLSGALTISALTELEPLIDMSFLQDDLQLNPARAAVLSPSRLRPALQLRKPLLAAVGEQESSEFHRQTDLLVAAWKGTLPCAVYDVPGTDHLSVCDAFARPGHALFKATCELLR